MGTKAKIPYRRLYSTRRGEPKTLVVGVAFEKKRKHGRPTAKAAESRRYKVNNIFKEYFGTDLWDAMVAKRYIILNKQRPPKKLEPKTVIVQDDKGIMSEVEVFQPKQDQMADRVVNQLLMAAVAGKQLDGFALVPKAKAAGNPSVESILIEDFIVGHPCYGMAFVKLKD